MKTPQNLTEEGIPKVYQKGRFGWKKLKFSRYCYRNSGLQAWDSVALFSRGIYLTSSVHRSQ
jgi:hypothetical protein